MKIGDLVQIEKWCKNKGALAVVVRTESWMPSAVWIRYMDGKQTVTGNEDGMAMKKNLILMSEGGINESRG